jgi:hypothetical protein
MGAEPAAWLFRDAFDLGATMILQCVEGRVEGIDSPSVCPARANTRVPATISVHAERYVRPLLSRHSVRWRPAILQQLPDLAVHVYPEPQSVVARWNHFEVASDAARVDPQVLLAAPRGSDL